MGKKGTKRKTRWRALTLSGGEECCNSGNEDETFEEDQSTTSSSAAAAATTGDNTRRYYNQQQTYRMGEKSYRQTRRYTYDRNRSREPLVKLEKKTFDEEEYTKITTPRQDVLFKKGYLGRRRVEPSADDNNHLSADGEPEPEVMEQLIITNGFVDERGHYLMNGSSYEIYDPYSNTVTVVVGPPPYPNGVTSPPVLAAVSCQPVPLHPLEWFPPSGNGEWNNQWMKHSNESASSPTSPVSGHESSCDSPVNYNQQHQYTHYHQPVYNSTLPAPYTNGVAHLDEESNIETNSNRASPNEKKVKQRRRRRRKSNEEEEEADEDEDDETSSEETEKKNIEQVSSEDGRIKPIITENKCKPLNQLAPPFVYKPQQQEEVVVEKKCLEIQTEELTNKINKESHSTQTIESQPQPVRLTNGKHAKESQSTQTNLENLAGTPKQTEVVTPPVVNSLNKTYSPRRNFNNDVEPRRFQNKQKDNNREREKKMVFVREKPTQETTVSKNQVTDDGFTVVSYARTLVNGVSFNKKNGERNKVVNNAPVKNKITNGNDRVTNGAASKIERENYYNRKLTTESKPATNGVGKTENRVKERKPSLRKPKLTKLTDFESPVSDHSETSLEPQSNSEKSSTLSELSSPTDLSSGQNTPPESVKKQKQVELNIEEKLQQHIEDDKVPQIDDSTKNITNSSKKSKKNNEVKTKKTKKKKKEEKVEKVEDENEDVFSFNDKQFSFLPNFLQPKPEDLLNNFKNTKTELDEFLSTNEDDILKTIQSTEKTLNLPKLRINPDMFMMYRPERLNKFSFEDCFTRNLKSVNNEIFTKTNITSMKSTKPEEFFASIVENPSPKVEIKKRNDTKEKKEVEKPTTEKQNNQILNKKNVHGPQQNIKLPKVKKNEVKVEEEVKKNEVEPEPAEDNKLKIVEAVTNWLESQEQPQVVLSVSSLPQSEDEQEDDETSQKNVKSNPLHVPSVDPRVGDITMDSVDEGCRRVAQNKKKLDGIFEDIKKITRAKSLDYLSEDKIKQKKHLLKQSATYYQDLLNNVKNGVSPNVDIHCDEQGVSSLCDSKLSVSKYYQLSLDDNNVESSDSETEAVDALEYKFLNQNIDTDQSINRTNNFTKDPYCKLQ